MAKTTKTRKKTAAGVELQVDIIESIENALYREGVSRAELSRRLGISKPATTTMLNENGNLTVRTVARVADALGYVVDMKLRKPREGK